MARATRLLPHGLPGGVGVSVPPGLVIPSARADTLGLAEALTRGHVTLRSLTDTVGLAETLTPSGITGALPALETWSVPDALGTLSGDHSWDDYIGTHGWQIIGGRARLVGVGGASNQGGRMMVHLGSADYTVGVTIRQWSMAGGDSWLGILGRMQGDQALTFFEALLLRNAAGGHTVRLYQFLNGVQTSISSAAGITAPIAGTTMALRLAGTSLGLYTDGALRVTLPTGAGAIMSGPFVGMLGGASAGSVIEVQPFTAQSLVIAAPGADPIVLTETLTPVVVPPLSGLPITETWDVENAAATMSGDHPWFGIFGGSDINGWGVVNGKLQLQGIGGTGAARGGRIQADIGQDDVRATLTIDEWHDTGTNLLVAGPMIRMPGTSAMTGYTPIVVTLNGVTTASIQRFINSVQIQVGPSISVVPHAGMTIGIQGEGDLLGLYFDGVRLWGQHDPDGILTGRFVGAQGVAGGTNRVRIGPLQLAVPSAGVLAPEVEALGLTEALQRLFARSVADPISLTEALIQQTVALKPVGDTVGLTETLAAATTRARTGLETVGLFESLGVLVQTQSPEVGEALGLTEALTGRIAVKSPAEVLTLTEALSRIFLGQMRVGILKLMDESVLVSGAGRRAAVTVAGECRLPIPELSGFDYQATLVGRDGRALQPADLSAMQCTLYNAADGAIINGVSRLNCLNIGKGTLSDAGVLVLTLDSADVAILDAAQAYEHHILLVEGAYDGGVRAFRRAIDHVVLNMVRVP